MKPKNDKQPNKDCYFATIHMHNIMMDGTNSYQVQTSLFVVRKYPEYSNRESAIFGFLEYLIWPRYSTNGFAFVRLGMKINGREIFSLYTGHVRYMQVLMQVCSLIGHQD